MWGRKVWGTKMPGTTMSLPVAALLFGGLWSAGMVWWKWPMATGEIISLVIAGAILGPVWAYVMSRYFSWMQRNRVTKDDGA